MAARSIWNGRLEVADAVMPVKVYAAVEDAAVHFNLLHDADGTRLKQRWVQVEGDQEQPAGSVQKGYPLDDGGFVVISDEELEALVPEASRSIQISAFVPLAAIDPVWYVRPYYLGNDGDGADYSALAQVLQEEQCAGLARWVMRKRIYHGALFSNSGYLMLTTLRNRDEVLLTPRVAAPARAFDERELKMANQLIEALFGEFEPSTFEDEHRQRVLELIEAKAKGSTTELAAPPSSKRPTSSLTDALARSLEALATSKPHKQPDARSKSRRKERKSA
ncbi:MAG TPA: Ku protein [Polyangiaceae bacterium]|jgi:DNA end-binding protein Ku|nr:Ku protein [Polyangiaceae bacterium]